MLGLFYHEIAGKSTDIGVGSIGDMRLQEKALILE
jgi:hypothetical protein